MAKLPTSTFTDIQEWSSLLSSITKEIGSSIAISQSILDMFQKTSVVSQTFHDHPVVLMTVSFMQKQEDYTWTTPNKSAASRGLLFASLQTSTSPSIVSIDGLRMTPLKAGGVALTAKAFFNSMRDFDDNINTDKINSEVSSLNQYFNDNAAALFAEYYRLQFGIAASRDAVRQYTALVQSRAYRERIAAALVNGLLANPALEMFNHFVKLKACGATDDDVAGVFNVLTGSNPVISEAVLSPLTARSWKSYRGWLSQGYLDWGDMGAQNLGSVDYYVPPVTQPGAIVMPIMFYFCESYIRHYGYWKNKSSTSCFSAESRIVLEDGKSTARIDEIKPGVVVQSVDFESGQLQSATVAYVSRVKRDGRPLYCVDKAPNILFTATHPLVTRPSRDNKTPTMPELALVHEDEACSHNPTWHSMPSRRLDEAREVHIDEQDKYDILCDLILEPSENAGPASYLIRDGATGEDIEALSEAPHMPWFPDATCFLFGMLAKCTADEVLAEEMLNRLRAVLESDKTRLATVLSGVARSNLTWLRGGSSESPSSEVKRQTITLEALLGKEPALQQKQADLLECCVGRLGRLINDHIHLGWVPAAENKPGADLAPFLVFHTLTYLRCSPLDHQAGYPTHQHLRLTVSVDNLVVAESSVSVHREGWMTFEIQRAVLLQTKRRPGNPVAGAKSVPWNVTVVINNVDSDDTLTGTTAGTGKDGVSSQALTHYKLAGGGPLIEGAMALIGLGGPAAEATLKVRLCMLNTDEVKKWQGGDSEAELGQWNEDAKMVFAKSLGADFVVEALKSED